MELTEILQIIQENLIQIVCSTGVIISVILGKNKTDKQIIQGKERKLEKTQKKGLKTLNKLKALENKAENLKKEIEKDVTSNK